MLELKGLSKKDKYQILKDLDFEQLEQELKEQLTIEAIKKYSIKNKILIILQKGFVSDIKGFRQLETIGLRPLPNSGIFIYAPNLYKNNETQEQELKGFRLITVFDIKETRPLTEQEISKSKYYNKELAIS